MNENNGLLIFFPVEWNGKKLKTQKLKCYVLGVKSQKIRTAENTRYTVLFFVTLFNSRSMDKLLPNKSYIDFPDGGMPVETGDAPPSYSSLVVSICLIIVCNEV